MKTETKQPWEDSFFYGINATSSEHVQICKAYFKAGWNAALNKAIERIEDKKPELDMLKSAS